MFRNLLSLALQAVLRKKRSSVLLFLVLLLSFSCAIVSLSLTESIGKTNEAYRLNTYGAWYLAFPDVREEDAQWLAQQSWAEQVSSSCLYGELYGTSVIFGTADDHYLDMARTRLLCGHLPQHDDEIVLTEEALRAFGYEDYALGQEISLAVTMFTERSTVMEGEGYAGGFAFKLCGVLEPYGDYWALPDNRNWRGLVSAIVTQGGAQRTYDKMKAIFAAELPGETLQSPMEQAFVCVQRENWAEAVQAAREYLAATRGEQEEKFLCVNYFAYPAETAAASSRELYAFLIAAVALVAVLCVYLMNLSAEAHSFAVLRAVGITKGQLLALMGLESLLLVAPAMVLGIPLGAFLTRFALRLLLYSGSVPVQTVVPYSALRLLFVLWLSVILLARLVIFLVTVRTPLTGGMQMRQEKARASRRFRRALIALLLLLWGSAVVYTTTEAVTDALYRRQFTSAPSYYLYSANTKKRDQTLTEALRGKLEALPGIAAAEGFFNLNSLEAKHRGASVSLSFEGLAEQQIDFFAIDYDRWEDTFSLSSAEADSFRRGEIVLLCFPEGTERPALPPGEIMLHACDAMHRCVAELPAVPRVWYAPKGMQGRLRMYVTAPYTVICSEACLRRLVSAMQPGTSWDIYDAGGEFSYQQLLITATDNADDLSTTPALELLCESEGLRMVNQWEWSKGTVHALTQELVMLCACGGCVALVTLLLLAGALLLETEQERRSYAILRVIGMSRRQMRRRISAKALARSAFAVLAGWALYAAFCIRTQLVLNGSPLAEAAQDAWNSFTYYGGPPLIAALSAVMLAVLLAVSLLSKRGLRHSALPK